MISAIVTAYERIEQTLATLRIIQSCTPPPDEILVHVDANRRDCEQAIRKAFPSVRVLRSHEHIGPGGGRNKLVDAAQSEFVASFDDDSYPIDSDYFARAAKLFEQFPDAAVICAALYHAGEAIGLDERSAEWTADFSGGACIYRRKAFLDAGGYVPLPVAYGMEEVDLAIRLHSRGGRILTTRWLRVFHNTNLERHADGGQHRESRVARVSEISGVAVGCWNRPVRESSGLVAATRPAPRDLERRDDDPVASAR